ncbi:MAG TPA: NADP-dependent oxidoreductase [Bacteroidales bacterium]|nr:NADP-dependent oxidoreductase [Bacteroidales bacterium]
MKAVIIKEFGDRSKLIYTDVEKPNVCEGEVLIRIKAAGVNPVDTKIREGLLAKRVPNKLPIVLGWDLAGIVVDTGHSARRFKPGDEVYAYARRMIIQNGTYAEYISLPESYVSHKPSNISFEEAASVPLAGLTAFQAIFEKGKLTKNQKLLVLGASGGVGSFAIQFAKVKGATVYALAGNKRADYLKEIGADYVLDYTQENWPATFRDLLPEGADCVFDCVGGETTVKAYEYVKKGGTLVSILSQANPELVDKYGITFKYLFVEPNVLQLEKIKDWLEKGKVKVSVQHVYPLKDAAKAHKQMETGHTQGKIVLQIP